MDPSNTPPGRSPRRELQGPRPAPLRVHKDSHKIKKPPMPPNPAAGQLQHLPRPPVIIYTVSPKIIHANPNEFMSLVQRLTGPNSSYATSPLASSPTTSYAFQDTGFAGALSPAARFASIEKTRSPDGRKGQVYDHHGLQEKSSIEGVEIGRDIQRTGQFPGILSPNPNTLPPIPPIFFSTPIDSNPLSFFNDFSPVLHSNNRNNIYSQENSFGMPSPFIFSPQINYMPSPNTLDLFNSLFDL